MNDVYNYLGSPLYVGQQFESPLMYGAKADGIHDDTVAIQNCINANKGKSIFFPEGVYVISDSIKTYPTDANNTNLFFHPNAVICAKSNVDYLLDIGSVSETYSRVDQKKKKYVHGGYFDASNGNVSVAAVHISDNVTNIDFSNAEILTGGCDGLIIGDADKRHSTDCYVHHLMIRRAKSSNDNIGVVVYSSDNSISDSRVYYHKTALQFWGGSSYVNNVHTLANDSQTDSISFDVRGTSVFLSNSYGDSENTFMTLKKRNGYIPEVYISNCQYYSCRTSPNVYFDIEDYAIIKVNGLRITCGANNVHTGMKFPYSSFSKQLSKAILEIDGLKIIGASNLRNGDPLKGLQTADKDTTFYPTSIVAGSWYLVGAMAINDTNNQSIRIKSENGDSVIPLSAKCDSSGALSVDLASGKIITTDSGVYQIGYKLINEGFDDASDYPIVNVYIKRVNGGSRTLYRFDMESNLMARLSPNGDYLATLSNVAITPDIICSVDCDNKTVGIVS